MQIADAKAKAGCKVRLGDMGSLVVKIGDSKTLGEFVVKVIAEDTKQAMTHKVKPNLELSRTEGDDSNFKSSQKPKLPKIEGYKISGILGQGGMGAVYRATQISTNRRVALKLLRGQTFNSAKAQARFEREIKLTSMIIHPNIAKIYDSGTYRGLCYYAMDLIDGIHLDQYVKNRGLAREQVLELFRRICRILTHN